MTKVFLLIVALNFIPLENFGASSSDTASFASLKKKKKKKGFFKKIFGKKDRCSCPKH